MVALEKPSDSYQEDPLLWRQVIILCAASVAAINASGLFFGSLTKSEFIINIILVVAGIAGQKLMFGSRFFVNNFLQTSLEVRDHDAFILGHRISVKSKLEKVIKKIDVLFFVRALIFFGLFFHVTKYIFTQPSLHGDVHLVGILVGIGLSLIITPALAWPPLVIAIFGLIIRGNPNQNSWATGALYGASLLLVFSAFLLHWANILDRHSTRHKSSTVVLGLGAPKLRSNLMWTMIIAASVYFCCDFLAKRDTAQTSKKRQIKSQITSRLNHDGESQDRSPGSMGTRRDDIGSNERARSEMNESTFAKLAQTIKNSSDTGASEGGKESNGRDESSGEKDSNGGDESDGVSESNDGDELAGGNESKDGDESEQTIQHNSARQQDGQSPMKGDRETKSSPTRKSVNKIKPIKPFLKLSKVLPALGILTALLVLFSLLTRRSKKASPENQEKSVKISLAKSVIQKLKEECQSDTFSWTMSSEELKNHVIKLYNSLIQVNQLMGLQRAPSMTPDEYNMLFASNAPASGRQMQLVTEVYSATYFGNQTPDKSTMEAYIESVSHCLLESYRSPLHNTGDRS